MKLLLDENLPRRLVQTLSSEFPGTKHVVELGLDHSPDDAIWDFAKKEGFVLISKDRDFAYRADVLGSPPKVVWVRTGNCSTADLEQLLAGSAPSLIDFESDPQSSLLVLPQGLTS